MANTFPSKFPYSASKDATPEQWVEDLNIWLEQQRGALPDASLGRTAAFKYMLANRRGKYFAILTTIGSAKAPQAPDTNGAWNVPAELEMKSPEDWASLGAPDEGLERDPQQVLNEIPAR